MPNIREMQRRLSQWATDHPEERYRDLFNLVCDPGWLSQAYYNISLNKGANTPGIDGIANGKWARSLATNMEQLYQELRDGTYRPQPCGDRGDLTGWFGCSCRMNREDLQS